MTPQSAAIGKLFEALTSPIDLHSVKFPLMECLRDFVGTQESAWLDMAATLRLGKFDNVCTGIRGSQLTAGLNHYSLRHPLLEFRHPPDPFIAPAYDVLDAVGDGNWFNSEIYQDYLSKFGLKAHINIHFCTPEGALHWAVGLVRESSRRPPKRVLATLTHLAPRISRALANLAIWDARWAGAQALAEHTREALAIVHLGSDERGPALQLASKAATRLLGLHSRPSARNWHLQEFLRLCPLAIGDAGGAILWQATDGRFYALSARRSATSNQVLAVGIMAPEGETLVSADFRQLVAAGLSRREAEVYALLARGLANKQIARQLHIANSTARTHVDHIFKKLKVNSRIEAINAMRAQNQSRGAVPT